MEYLTVSLEDQHRVAMEHLHARELDHFRLTLVTSEDTAPRRAALEAEIEAAKTRADEVASEIARTRRPASAPGRPNGAKE